MKMDREGLASNPTPMLERESSSCTIFEFEDDQNLESHDLHYIPLTNFDFPHSAEIKGIRWFRFSMVLSLLMEGGRSFLNLSVMFTLLEHDHGDVLNLVPCLRIVPRVFLNGNLHWIVSDSDSKLWISCFDLETERFSTFSTPPLLYEEGDKLIGALCALGDWLCLCDHTGEDGTVMWMKEYGVDKSWTKEYVIKIRDHLDIEEFELVTRIRASLLLLQQDSKLLKKFTSDADPNSYFVSSILLTPSFLSLKSLKMENVFSF